ncbi:MAG TPA: histidine kinase [Thermoanaerobaculia bacterium]
MTRLHLLGLARVRRSLILPVVAFTIVNAALHARDFRSYGFWIPPTYVLFDSSLWIGAAFLIFAVIEWRQTRPRQPRLAAMAAATAGISALSAAMVSARAFFEATVLQLPFVSVWLSYLPGDFFKATFYLAIVTGMGYAVYSWAVEDHRLAEEAELDTAIARAELKAAAGRLQPELLNAALTRISGVMATNVPEAQRLIADLGALLHDSLRHPQPELVPLGEELDYIERYLGFQRSVLEGPIHLSIEADANARSLHVPNLAVLALVQNAIAQSAHTRIDLSITATTADGVVTIAVSERRIELELPAA